MSIEIPVTLQENLAGRYALERLIARGGMASVYLGRDLKHDRAVAVKVLRPELGALLGAERFLREIKVVARLQHPHILPLYDSGEAGGTLYYVMPYVPGDSLRDRLRRERRLPLRDTLWIAREVADALYYAHANEIVHRDIKPENILLSGVHAMVADFGIARAVHVAGGERWETLTDSGVAVGTPAYMSPEQTAGEHDVDGRSDIFSLGCVVYEMLAGTPPFMGPDGEVMIAKRFTDPAPVLRAVRDDVPESLDEAVQRALAKEPAQRFANALEFTEAIWDDTRATARVQPVKRSPAASRRNTKLTRSRSPWALGGIAVVGAAALAALWVMKSPEAPTTASQSAAPIVALPETARPATPLQQQGGNQPTGNAARGVAAANNPTAGSPAASNPAAGSAGTDSPAANNPAAVPPVVKREPAPRPQTRPVPQRVSPEPPVQVPAITAPRPDSVLSSLRIAAHEARGRAVSDGATQFDLFRGDSLERAAEAAAARGRVADAISQLMSASTAWADGARAARSRRIQPTPARDSAAVPAPPPAVTAKAPEEPVTTTPTDSEQRAAIGAVITNYGRAIEARSLPAIQQIYPAITAAQQRDWQQFFDDVQNVKVSLAVTQLDITGATAAARITGTYKYENTSARRLEEQPVSFRASLRRDAAGWRLTGIQ